MSKALAKRVRAGIPQHYDPQKGLAKVAVAEAAEKRFAKAKDATRLLAAVALKLTEQRNFVLWWDGQEKQAGALKRGEQLSRRSRSATPGLNTLGLDRTTVHRWRKRLGEEDAFNDALEQAQQKCLVICESKAGDGSHVAKNTGLHEWYTPAAIIEKARLVLGTIDLDPASHDAAQKIIKAKRHYTASDDGLSKEWKGTVWLNPPYSQPAIEQFCTKLVSEIDAKRTTAAISLTNNGTETQWGQALLLACAAACFPSGRVEFWNPTKLAVPLQGQMICYFGGDAKAFAAVFGPLGVVLHG